MSIHAAIGESACKHCGCLDSMHDIEQDARECMPMQIGVLRAQLADAAAVLKVIGQMPGFGLHDGRELIRRAARMASEKATDIDKFLEQSK